MANVTVVNIHNKYSVSLSPTQCNKYWLLVNKSQTVATVASDFGSAFSIDNLCPVFGDSINHYSRQGYCHPYQAPDQIISGSDNSTGD